MESTTKTILTKQQVHNIINHHFPEENLSSMEELNEGMQNAAWLIKGSGILQKGVVLKIGASADADLLTYEKENLVAEYHAYEKLKGKGLPIPNILVYDDTFSIISNPYLIMTCMKGRTWRSCLKDIEECNKPQLMNELGQYTATIHSVIGKKFGYVKRDERLLFDTWGEAFCGMMDAILSDGKKKNYILPYEKIIALLQKSVPLLNQIKIPHLVDFDLWAGNIFVNAPECNHITGIIDFGNCFYGDSFAEFVTAVHLYKDVQQELDFQKGYMEVSGKPFVITEEDCVRMELYGLYLDVILFVESYRYDEKYGQAVRKNMGEKIEKRVLNLNKIVA